MHTFGGEQKVLFDYTKLMCNMVGIIALVTWGIEYNTPVFVQLQDGSACMSSHDDALRSDQ